MSEAQEMVILLGEENTKMMAEKFQVMYPTPVDTDMEKKIQNRLLNGFENWNRGFEAWKEWGNTLYTNDSIYNVHSVRLTLQEYQMAMFGTLKRNPIMMGDFYDMLIVDDWTAIHYAISTTGADGTEHPGSVMEFVKFHDYGEEMGARVVEGWAGTRAEDYDMLSRIQNPEGKAIQESVMKEVLDTVIPDTDDLTVKYPVKYPTTFKTALAEKIRMAVLKEFDAWNAGYEAWEAYTDSMAADGFCRNLYLKEQDLAAYKATEKERMEKDGMKRIFFDSLIVSGDRAAIHYRVTKIDPATGERYAADMMEHIHFVEDGDGVKMDARWTS